MSDSNNISDESTAGDNFFGQMIEAGIADEKFIREIVEMFLEEGKQSLGKLKTAFAAGEPEDVRLFAHKLKSSFLMFDMHKEHALAVELEKVRQDNIDDFVDRMRLLELACEESFKHLRGKYL